jgi:hypothetical protein
MGRRRSVTSGLSEVAAEVRGLGKLECIVGEINDFEFDTFLKLEPVK